MKCKFWESQECIHPQEFEHWKDDKRETAFLHLGLCPECSVYKTGEQEKGKVSNMENGGGVIEGAVKRRHTGKIVYRGARGMAAGGGPIVTRNAQLLRPWDSQQLFNHSPDGFEWGYSGSGPAQLALALLLDATGDPGLALSQHQNFKRGFVERFGDEWELTADEIIAWVNSLQKRPVDEATLGQDHFKAAVNSYLGHPV